MFVDAHNMFSNAQALTATAASTSVIDTTKPRYGGGKPLKVFFNIQTQLASALNTSTLVITLQSDSDEAFGTAVSHSATAALAEAVLVTGYHVELPYVPEDCGRYIRLYYTVGVASFTSGNIDAGIVLDKQTNRYEAMAEFV